METTMPTATRAYEIMSHPVETVSVTSGVHEVASLFLDKKISAAVVLDRNGKAMGVVTKTDLVRYENENDNNTVSDKNPEGSSWATQETKKGFHVVDEKTIEEWVTPMIFSCKAEDSIKMVAAQMVRNGLHHIVVRDSDKAPIQGIVSSFDILQWFSKV